MLFSEPKIPHSSIRLWASWHWPCFSALQRAENSSSSSVGSGSFLVSSFSALQRAENSSLEVGAEARAPVAPVSVLFSEPKIPHAFVRLPVTLMVVVSVLFSEPKIPHFDGSRVPATSLLFQCSSASRKFLTAVRGCAAVRVLCFSALQRAENSSPVARNRDAPGA